MDHTEGKPLIRNDDVFALISITLVSINLCNVDKRVESNTQPSRTKHNEAKLIRTTLTS